jgi:large subunit ribosomal protein L27
MAKTKNTGGTKLGRDSNPKFMGVKVFAGQPVKTGSIIVRQRGTSIIAGKNVKTGSDNTLYSVAEGVVNYRETRKKCFNGTQRLAKVAEVITTVK